MSSLAAATALAHSDKAIAVDPIRPLLILIWMLPILWLVGGERLLFPFLAVGLLLPRIRKNKGSAVSMIAPAWWLLAFIFTCSLSILQINTDVRVATFLWDLSIYIGFFCTILFITKNVTEFDQINRILLHLVLFGVVAQIFASTYFTIGSWRYESLLGQMLPGNIRETMIGRGVLIRAVGKELWLLGINERVKSFFSSSIHFGTVVMMIIGITVYFVSVLKGHKRLLSLLLLASCAFFLLYSQSRTAMVLSVFMIAFAMMTISASRSRAFGPTLLGTILLGCAAIMAIFTAVLWDDIWAAVQELFIESRAASFDNRSEIYRQTIEWILRQPIFGYGTQTDVPGLGYPLGSHNWYLAILFKHGLIAFIPFVVFIGSLVSCSIGNMFRVYERPEIRVLAIALTSWLGFYLILCMTIEPVVDAMHLFVAGCLFGIILTLPRFARHRQKYEHGGQVEADGPDRWLLRT